jgi:predicted metal-binding membrane protein
VEHETSDGLTVRRDRVALPAGYGLVAVLLVVAGGAWLLSERLATPDMRLGVLTRAPMASAGGQMGMSGSMSMALGVFLATWTVMMVAMMVPSVLPAVKTFDRWAHRTRQPGGGPVLFTMGYLLVWSAIGGVAYLVVQALQDWLPAGNMTALRVGAVLLAVAGVYQLMPLKQACLRHCRWPHRGVTPEGSRGLGYLGAVRAGLWQGVYCLGSSWLLMLVLLLGGMMNVVWMAAIAGVIFVEKAMPGGVVFGKLVGCGLAGFGIILLTAPHTMPVLGGA